MALLQDKLSVKLDEWRKEINELSRGNNDKVISEVTVSQAYGGMRGVRSLICDTSRVPADEGLIIRGKRLPALADKTPEEVFFLLLTGEMSSEEELQDLKSLLRKRKKIPGYVWDVLKAMPHDSHPMTMFNTAILVLQKESAFAREYDKGIKKDEYWIPTLEDALNIIAKVPGIAAGVYRIKFSGGELIEPRNDDDFTGDFVNMIGLNKGEDFYDLMRLYFVAHCDHEGGNVSALTTQTINSALSDLYYSLSGGFNGLAGPLHGLANQESLKWILDLMERYNGAPDENQLKDLVWETLDSGKVIPGYGHAVLRVVDPRFTAFLEFGKKHCSDDPVFITVERLFKVVPEELKKIEKIKNPWPNVDAASGSLLYHYGITQFSYYTVCFAVSRALGLAAQAVINRGLMSPLIRPKSVTTEWIKDFIKSNN
jgi:citrate synthase